MPDAAAPTGLVALVFTDVQASTTLWERAPDAMREALALHDGVLRELIARHEGYEVKTEGDSFMVAFSTAAKAAAWCLATQAALNRAAWPAGLLADPIAAEETASGVVLRRGLRVRMGLHVGEPECRRDPTTGRMDYVGPAVNRAARVSAAAHGGQILLSRAAWEALSGRPPADAEAVDLGEHRLKGLDGAERLVQLLPRELAGRRFPPPKTVEARRTNLPFEAGTFLGREALLEEVAELVERGERVVVLLGTGGIGKTRLALRLGWSRMEAHVGGVWFLDLADCRTLEDLCGAAGAALGVPLESSGRSTAEALTTLGQALAGRGNTLVLADSAEPVREPLGGAITRWRAAAPEARFVVTSRERLDVPGEIDVEVVPLDTGGPDSEAVRLFLGRASRARPGYRPSEEDLRAIEEIVRALDGIPLAIELAAARMRVLGPAKILERLPRRFDLLAGGTESRRQATLRSTLDGSWDLLRAHEKDALAQCAVFRGGFTLEAAEAVIDLTTHAQAPWTLDVIQSLKDKSLLRAQEDAHGEIRFSMFASVLEYAAEKLAASPTLGEAQARHTRHYLGRGEEHAAGADGPDDLRHLAGLVSELDNLLAVFDRAIERGDAGVAARAILCVEPVLSARGPADVLLTRLERAANAFGARPAARLQVRLLEARGRALRARGRAEESLAELERALRLALDTHDLSLASRVRAQLGNTRYSLGALAAARANLEEAVGLASAAGDRLAEALAQVFLGSVLASLGDTGGAHRCYDRAHAILDENGSRRARGMLEANQGILLRREGRLAEAIEHYTRSRTLYAEVGDRRLEGNAVGSLAGALLEQGRHDDARPLYEEAIRIQREVGNRRSEALFTGNLGILELESGRLHAAAAELKRALAILQEIGDARHEGLYGGFRAAVFVREGSLDHAEQLFERAELALASSGDKLYLQAVRLLRGTLELRRARALPAPESDALLAGIWERIHAAENPPEDDAGGRAPEEVSEDVRFALRILKLALLDERDASP